MHIYFISNIRFSIYSTSIISKYSGASYSFENSANELQKISETITTKKKVQRRRAFIFITSHTLKILLAVIGSIWCVTSLWPLMSVWSGRPVWLSLLPKVTLPSSYRRTCKIKCNFHAKHFITVCILLSCFASSLFSLSACVSNHGSLWSSYEWWTVLIIKEWEGGREGMEGGRCGHKTIQFQPLKPSPPTTLQPPPISLIYLSILPLFV